jgi:hypothetical protein
MSRALKSEAERRLNTAIEECGFRVSPRQSFHSRVVRYLELKSHVVIRAHIEAAIKRKGWQINLRVGLRDLLRQYMLVSGQGTTHDEIEEAIDEYLMEEKNRFAKPILGNLYGKNLDF